MVVLTASSEVYSWGSNLAGQLGRELQNLPPSSLKEELRGGALVRCPPRRPSYTMIRCAACTLIAAISRGARAVCLLWSRLYPRCMRSLHAAAAKDVQLIFHRYYYQPLVHAMVKVRDDVSGVKRGGRVTRTRWANCVKIKHIEEEEEEEQQPVFRAVRTNEADVLRLILARASHRM